jgi:hypothetical protein
MAAANHNPSRRALLGAAVGFPLASSFPRKRESRCSSEGEGRWIPDQVRDDGADQVWGDGEWMGALAKFRAAEAEMRGVERATAGGSAEEEEIWLPLYEARLDEMGGAIRAVMVAPAPDFGAFAVKLELFFEYELEPHSADEEVLAAVLGDAWRLAGQKVRPSRN